MYSILEDETDLLLLLQPVLTLAFAHFFLRDITGRAGTPHQKYPSAGLVWTVQSLTDFECWTWFRFKKSDITLLVDRLNIGDMFSRSQCQGVPGTSPLSDIANLIANSHGLQEKDAIH
jgi:hypothetical protein